MANFLWCLYNFSGLPKTRINMCSPKKLFCTGAMRVRRWSIFGWKPHWWKFGENRTTGSRHTAELTWGEIVQEVPVRKRHIFVNIGRIEMGQKTNEGSHRGLYFTMNKWLFVKNSSCIDLRVPNSIILLWGN